jgi:hypothetical protein
MANICDGQFINNTANINQETIILVFWDYFISKSKPDLPALAKTLAMAAQMDFFWGTMQLKSNIIPILNQSAIFC